MICRKCSTPHHSGTVGFKAFCEKCGVYLHSCYQCALYDEAAGRCRSLTTEQAGDRESLNFCEEYLPNTMHPGASSRQGISGQARERFLNLFDGDDGE